jgi:RND superfamily putative drug exporter
LGTGSDIPAAVRTTMSTAGRTVAYSAITVAIAMCSLVVFPLRFLQSMGIGGAITALVAAAVALTLLPALFVLAGGRLGHVRPGPVREGRWYRLAHAVLRRPGLVGLIVTAALVALTLPALHTRWSGVDAHVLPTSTSARQVEGALQREYPHARTTPEYVSLHASATEAAAVRAYGARVGRIAGVRRVAPPQYLGADTWQLNVTLAGEAIAPAAQRAIASMRATPSQFASQIGGSGAEFTDQRAAIARELPIAIAILACGTLLVLWLMTDSVVLPLMALAMNALTVGAATGLLVLIFQDGRLEGPLAYTSQHGIEQSDYLVLAAIAFALSTDYGVFLFTRIKEAHDRGAGDREAVAQGLQRTGRIVTAAAVLLSVAIGAFATSNVVFLKEIGVGAVAAVLLDAFLVRTLLVPALMGMLGRYSWYSPRLLSRLHERVALREAPPEGARTAIGDQAPG